MSLRRRLLVVDDSAPVRALVGQLAAELGFTVVGGAADGPAGVAAAAELKPDVVVMDWQMPGFEGVEATRQILAGQPHIDVVAFSSADEDAIGIAFRRAGASAYVVKGDVEGLIDALRGRSGA